MLTRLVVPLADAGERDLAVAVARQATTSARMAGSLGEWLLEDLVTAWARLGELEQAETLVHLTTSSYRRNRGLAVLAMAWIAAGDLGHARAVIERISPPEARIEVMERLADALMGDALARDIDIDDLESTVRLLVDDPDPDTQDRVSSLLVTVLAGAGHRERAQSVAETIGNVSLRSEALVVVLTTFAPMSEPEQVLLMTEAAEASARAQPDDEDQARLLTKIAEALVSVRFLEKATNTADLAQESAMRISDDLARAKALADLVDIYAQAGQPERSRDVAAAAETAARQLQRGNAATDDIVEDLLGLAEKLADAGARQALSIGALAGHAALATDSQDDRSEALAAVVAGLGEEDRALVLARTIPHPRYRAEALVDVLARFAGSERGAPVLALADEVRDAVLTLQEPRTKVTVLTGLSTALIAAGERTQALQVALDAEQAAHAAERQRDQAATLSGLAWALHEANERDEALRLAEAADQAARASSKDPDAGGYSIIGDVIGVAVTWLLGLGFIAAGLGFSFYALKTEWSLGGLFLAVLGLGWAFIGFLVLIGAEI